MLLPCVDGARQPSSARMCPPIYPSSKSGLFSSRVALSVTRDCCTNLGHGLVCALVWYLAKASPMLPEQGLSSSPASLGQLREQPCVHISICFRDLPIS